ncbi:hypothetical protein CF326_g6741 [Tilletia indica]|uniref:Reverse transcriptase RNase H-like domain-containing protein n=1 Tax=Tilletia indica TaxID=43049 RepID=A0A177TBU6_9BASI|nr:hypothetical protein CF326_g6741 [Tilletia indica]KAE8241239.1 hypothetical protein A4X13_0g7502 [Tilletia indica]
MDIGAELSVDQLDVLPPSPDPFHTHRPVAEPSTSEVQLEDLGDAEIGSVRDDDAVGAEPPPLLPERRRLTPVRLQDFEVGTVAGPLAIPPEMLRGPLFRPKQVQIEGRTVTLVERPVGFLSRLTTVTEKRLVAPELELSCLAWAFGQWAHLLEGASVLVVTDHAPMAAMLTSSSSTRYGSTITKCRALLLPHLHNLSFEHRAGRHHTNADSLSRLVAYEVDEDPGRPSA